MESAMAEDGACTRECDEQLRHIMTVHVRQFTAPKVRFALACLQAFTSACTTMHGCQVAAPGPRILARLSFHRKPGKAQYQKP